ncbi:MAG: hypothetical protein WCL39_11385 [Armatimonadota bacterium]
MQAGRLAQMINAHMDFMTNALLIGDAEAVEQATFILQINRLSQAIEILYGKPIDADIRRHSLFKEVRDLYSRSSITFETAVHNIYSAASIQSDSGHTAKMVAEKRDERTPDLVVANTAYVECKDTQSLSVRNLKSTIRDNITSAYGQLQVAQQQSELPLLGICLDVPYALIGHAIASKQYVEASFVQCPDLSFVLLSFTGLKIETRDVGYPRSDAIFVRESTSCELKECFLSRIAARVWPIR